MPGQTADKAATERIELTIRRLESLYTLPSVATRFLSVLLEDTTGTGKLAEIIESDPALAARMFSVIQQQGGDAGKPGFSLRRAVRKLPRHVIRDAFFSVQVYQSPDTDSNGQDQIVTLADLLTHSLAVACCAGEIAEAAGGVVEPELAYTAGLLHDIGKLALHKTMPKSFARIVQEAKARQCSICTIEQQHLGMDHTIIGKRLGQKWQLPEPIILAIWLHHSDTQRVARTMNEAVIAEVVQAADIAARLVQIGQPGSFDSVVVPGQILKSLGIGPKQLEEICGELAASVAEKSKLPALDAAEAAAEYCRLVHSKAARLARQQAELSVSNRELQTKSRHLEFAIDFLQNVACCMPPIEMMEDFAARWQRFYQTGPVCLYLSGAGDRAPLEVIVVQEGGQSRLVCATGPSAEPVVPEEVSGGFGIVSAAEHMDWLLEQLDVDFDTSRTKLVPLLLRNRAIGAVIFESRHPGQTEAAAGMEASVCFVGPVLYMAFACERQRDLAEGFAQILATQKQLEQPPKNESEKPPASVVSEEVLNVLADVGAGAAHELNNPLSVVSGRAQLLSESETDEEKKEILHQIRANAAEISGIVDDLMGYAEPPEPRPGKMAVEQILQEAIYLAAQRKALKPEKLGVEVDISKVVESVLVDSAQIVSAISNIICNAVEAYPDQAGAVEVTVAIGEDSETVELAISDWGCGMDAATAAKATRPFFSAKPAGRQRGMGLAYAQRLICLNRGRLSITSEPGRGTTVTIVLPAG